MVAFLEVFLFPTLLPAKERKKEKHFSSMTEFVILCSAKDEKEVVAVIAHEVGHSFYTVPEMRKKLLRS